MKTLLIEDETWQELSKLKIELMHRSLGETIKYLLYENDKQGGEE